MSSKPAVARQVDGVSVRHGATGAEEALAALPADDGAHLPQHVLLHQREYRGHLISVDGRIEGVRQPLAQQPVRVQAGVELVDEVRMAGLHAVADDVARQRQQLLVTDAVGRQREINHGAQIVRSHPFDHSIFAGGGLCAIRINIDISEMQAEKPEMRERLN